MASSIPRTTTYRSRTTGRTYRVEYRTGFRGREFNAGGGWRPTLHAAHVAAEKSQALTETVR
jgi:hypothetical protein